MGSTRKDLLDWDEPKPSFAESALLVCNKDALPHKNKEPSSSKESKGVLSTTSVPTSQVLGKVKDFLRIMAEANRKLEVDAKEKPRADYDIEVLTGNEDEYIEMDLLLGVADLHTPEAIAAAESAMGGASKSSFPSASHSSSSDSEDSDEDDNETNSNNSSQKPNSDCDDSCSTEQPKKRPKITELN
ncbi:hypothetical protein QJS10_CPB22g00976 [Acorus calamus]|uniref:Uncharacterized protein n=1 Tax=Acorus calamus TaxID=4465 RepID=A0AAV9C0N5_ACOCL|nr:hypothetical protein QJS10_CPB22g00976 [Acorus calamus]